MTVSRSAERVKKLKISPAGPGLVGFRASLEDRAEGLAGEEGEVIHSLVIVGTISLPDLVIRSAEPLAIRHPYDECAPSLGPVRRLVGMTIGPGYRGRVQELMGGTKGCSHFLTLALDLAASHTLTLFLRMREEEEFARRNAPDSKWIRIGLAAEPRLENACIALTSDSRMLRQAKQSPD